MLTVGRSFNYSAEGNFPIQPYRDVPTYGVYLSQSILESFSCFWVYFQVLTYTNPKNGVQKYLYMLILITRLHIRSNKELFLRIFVKYSANENQRIFGVKMTELSACHRSLIGQVTPGPLFQHKKTIIFAKKIHTRYCSG